MRLNDTRIAEAATVEALTRHAREGYSGHPSQQVRLIVADPALPADAEDLRHLPIERHSWTISSAEKDEHSTVRNIRTAPGHLQATPATASVRHRTPRPSPARRTAEEHHHATAAAPQPAAALQHVTIAAESRTGSTTPHR
ncbi:hypothetical protein [Kocuria aegyptia]|uniref:Uncharacterized protein n=1 Tax=Kocuria aegyptia TaxID=330943 RepID=A0ABP4WFC7_9MICC